MKQERDAFDFLADIIDPPDDNWNPLPHQIPPPGEWFVWMLFGGRGAGKTATCARDMYEHVYGPPCLPDVPGGHWPAIIAPTLGDGITSCVNGPSGLKVHDKSAKALNTPGGTVVRFGNGTEAKIFGAHSPEDVERLRSGGNRCYVWAEELAAWRYLEECWQHMRYGLRVGPWPHVVVSTTPKARPLIKKLYKQAVQASEEREPNPEVVLTHGTTDDNPHLDGRIKRMLYEDYAGTRLGRQELLGRILEDVEGALWTPTLIDDGRITPQDQPTSFDKIVVGVDPSGSSKSGTTGIVVVGMLRRWEEGKLLGFDHPGPHGFVLGDYSAEKASPKEWARRVLLAYNDFDANYVVAETNFGWDLVTGNLRAEAPTLPVKQVVASRGKEIRAEPVVTLYEQGRMHHVGDLPRLEDQMTTWEPHPEGGKRPASPDLIDGLVWGSTELLIRHTMIQNGRVRDRRLAGRR